MEGPTFLDCVEPLYAASTRPPSNDRFIVFHCHSLNLLLAECNFTAAAAALRAELVLTPFFSFWIPSSPIRFTDDFQQPLNHWAEASSLITMANAEPSHNGWGFLGPFSISFISLLFDPESILFEITTGFQCWLTGVIRHHWCYKSQHLHCSYFSLSIRATPTFENNNFFLIFTLFLSNWGNLAHSPPPV